MVDVDVSCALTGLVMYQNEGKRKKEEVPSIIRYFCQTLPRKKISRTKGRENLQFTPLLICFSADDSCSDMNLKSEKI